MESRGSLDAREKNLTGETCNSTPLLFPSPLPVRHSIIYESFFPVRMPFVTTLRANSRCPREPCASARLSIMLIVLSASTHSRFFLWNTACALLEKREAVTRPNVFRAIHIWISSWKWQPTGETNSISCMQIPRRGIFNRERNIVEALQPTACLHFFFFPFLPQQTRLRSADVVLRVSRTNVREQRVSLGMQGRAGGVGLRIG